METQQTQATRQHLQATRQQIAIKRHQAHHPRTKRRHQSQNTLCWIAAALPPSALSESLSLHSRAAAARPRDEPPPPSKDVRSGWWLYPAPLAEDEPAAALSLTLKRGPTTLWQGDVWPGAAADRVVFAVEDGSARPVVAAPAALDRPMTTDNGRAALVGWGGILLIGLLGMLRWQTRR